MQDVSGVRVKHLPYGSDGRFARMDAVTRTEPDIGRRMAVRKPWARMVPSHGALALVQLAFTNRQLMRSKAGGEYIKKAWKRLVQAET
jgi:hypothetical protein